MAHLDTLKIVASPAHQPKSAEQARRDKMIGKLQEQLALAEADMGGAAYARQRWITEVNEDGEPVRVQRAVRLKRWWFKSPAGSTFLTVRYGARPIQINKDKAAIEVGGIGELPKVIQTVIAAVDAGELDRQLADIATDRRSITSKSVTKIQTKR